MRNSESVTPAIINVAWLADAQHAEGGLKAPFDFSRHLIDAPAMTRTVQTQDFAGLDTEFKRGLGLFDSTMVVAGSMIGSGIFIVSAGMSREIGSAGWLLVAWVITGALTIAAALSYGELAAMMPRAGGQYVYLREAYSPLCAFLYGWTLFMVIQTGTIAAVAVGFARFTGVLMPWIAEDRYLIAPIHVSEGYAVSLSTAQLVGVAMIALLTWTNTRGLDYGRVIQNVFTTAKTGALIGLIALALLLGWNAEAIGTNFGNFWTAAGFASIAPGVTAATAYGLFVALCVSQTGSLFSADAWNNITFTAGEVKDPRRNVPLSLALGTGLVITLYLLANIGYLVTLPLPAMQHAPSDRVATATLDAIFPGFGALLMAVAIMISTFGARVLRDGPRWPVLRACRRTESCAGAGMGSVVPGHLGRRAGAAENLQPGNAAVRKSVRQSARLRRLGRPALLHSDDRWRVSPACDAARYATAISRLRLSRRPIAVYRRRDHNPRHAVDLQAGDDVAGICDRGDRCAGVLVIPSEVGEALHRRRSKAHGGRLQPV
jgi:amino acid transporter